ncbi:MAG TPA: hypothetical protein DCW31_01110 [Lactobacillus sp.]|nr:hypothetical protein [Lactobacillus sp.]
MFYLRALDGDRDTTTPGLRKYFSAQKFERLFLPHLLGDISHSLRLWTVVYTRESQTDAWSQNLEIRKLLDILVDFPNEFWKYPVNTYYLEYSEQDHFESNFKVFLEQLVAGLIGRFIVQPGVNAVKNSILILNVATINNKQPSFHPDIDRDELIQKMELPHYRIVKCLLKFLAYQNGHQTTLLPEHWEIDHILPKKWQQNYLFGYKRDEVEEVIEHIGNKIPLEKKLNISAANNYFGEKKIRYRESKIAIARELGSSTEENWVIEDIKSRDKRICDSVVAFIGKHIDSFEDGLSDADRQLANEWKNLSANEYLRLSEAMKLKYNQLSEAGKFK